MNRRSLLTGCASTGLVWLTGCTGESNPETTSPTTWDLTVDRTTETTVSTTTAPSEPAVDVAIQNATVTTRETATRNETAVTGTIENTGDVQLGYVNAKASFYNEDKDLLNTSLGDVRLLDPGEVWEPWLPYSGETDVVETAELHIAEAARLVRTASPDGIELRDYSVEVPNDANARVQVTGRVANTSGRAIDYLDVRSKVYAENGNLLGTGIKSISRFNAGDVWRFDAPVYLRNADWKSRIDSHDVVFTQ